MTAVHRLKCNVRYTCQVPLGLSLRDRRLYTLRYAKAPVDEIVTTARIAAEWDPVLPVPHPAMVTSPTMVRPVGRDAGAGAPADETG